jgi:hypothetical protein
VGLVFEETKTRQPVGPHDPQVQKSSLNNTPGNMLRLATFEAKRDYPGKAFNGYHYEIVEDGAGVKHYNLTVYLCDDVPTPGLNPHNLNGAEQVLFGQYLTPEEIERIGIGQKDRRA